MNNLCLDSYYGFFRPDYSQENRSREKKLHGSTVQQILSPLQKDMLCSCDLSNA